MQPKYDSHKIVRIRTGDGSVKVKVRDYGGNEAIKNLQEFAGIAGKIRNQVVGPSMEWQIPQWLYDIEIESGSRIYKVPEQSLEALA